MSSHCYCASDWSSPQLLALVVAIEEYGDTLPQGSTKRDCIREAVRQIGLADKHTETVASAAPLSLPTAETPGDGIMSDENDWQNRASEVRNTQQTSDMVERVARLRRFIETRKRLASPSAADEQRLIADLEAIITHHAEPVEALRQTTEIIGVRYNADSAPTLERVERENRELLTKIGGAS